MENPWEKVAEKWGNELDEYVLDGDKPVIEDILKVQESRKKKEKFELKFNLYPEPFIGKPKAPIYLLNLNPGFSSKDYEDKLKIKNYVLKNYKHQYLGCPFYYLDSDLKETNGGKWWRKRFKNDLEKIKKEKSIKDDEAYKLIGEKIFCVEYFPYHSRNYDEIISRYIIKSQEYVRYLVKTAIARNTIFIIMRSEKIWYKLVKELENYVITSGRVFFCRDRQNPLINEEHIVKKEGFTLIKDVINN